MTSRQREDGARGLMFVRGLLVTTVRQVAEMRCRASKSFKRQGEREGARANARGNDKRLRALRHGYTSYRNACVSFPNETDNLNYEQNLKRGANYEYRRQVKYFFACAASN